MFRLFVKRNPAEGVPADDNYLNLKPKDYRVDIGDEVQPWLTKLSPLIQEVLQDPEIKLAIETCKDQSLKYDELFVLRYIISEKGSKKDTIQAIKDALAYRNKHYEMFNTIKLSPIGDPDQIFTGGIAGSKLNKQLALLNHHLCGAYIGTVDMPIAVPIFVGRPKFHQMKTLMKMPEIDADCPALFIVSVCELLYRISDEVTRRTGRMSKHIEIIDGDSWSPFAKEFDMKFMKSFAAASKICEFLYPQGLAIRCGINPPAALLAFIRLFRKLMSKRSMEKLAICTGGKTYTGKSADTCPFVKRHGLYAVLPKVFGGPAATPECLMGIKGHMKVDNEENENLKESEEIIDEQLMAQQLEELSAEVIMEETD